MNGKNKFILLGIMPDCLKINRTRIIQGGVVEIPDDLLGSLGELHAGDTVFVALNDNAICLTSMESPVGALGFSGLLKTDTGVCLPNDYLDYLQIQDGDYVEISYSAEKQAIIVTPAWRGIYAYFMPRLEEKPAHEIKGYIDSCNKMAELTRRKAQWYQDVSEFCGKYLEVQKNKK